MSLLKSMPQAEGDVQKKVDTYLDKTLARFLIKEFQKLSPDVWAVVYPEQGLVCFFYKRIIFHKVHMNVIDSQTSIEFHVKQGATHLRALKLGLIPAKDLEGISLAADKIDLTLGKKL